MKIVNDSFHFQTRTCNRCDTIHGDTIRVSTPSTPINIETIFNPDLQKAVIPDTD